MYFTNPFNTKPVRQNQYETNKQAGLDGLKQKGNAGYAIETITLLKTTLQNMLESGEIIVIERK